MGRWAQARQRGSVYAGDTRPSIPGPAATEWTVTDDTSGAVGADTNPATAPAGATATQMQSTDITGALHQSTIQGLGFHTSIPGVGAGVPLRVQVAWAKFTGRISDWSDIKTITLM